MSRDYRFMVLDTSGQAISEVGIVCLNDADALVVALHVAPRNDVEVWDEDRFIGLVPTPNPRPAPDAAQPDDGTAPPVEAEPLLEPEPVVWDDPSRPFNPFRRGSWRRRMQPR